MRALETVAQGFGVSAEAMRSSTQALHRNVRDDPKIAALLEQLHITLSDGAGGQRNSADLMLELSDALKRMDPTQARETGQSLGLDAGVMEVLRSPESVSYTHLDVYKRQDQLRRLLPAGHGGAAAFGARPAGAVRPGGHPQPAGRCV